MDALRARLQNLKTVSQNQLLVANSQFQQYQKELEAVKSYGKREEEEKNNQEDRKKNVVRESSQVITSIRNIFARCLSSLKVNPLIHQGKDISLYESLEANLDVVLDRITDLQSIIQDYRLGKPAGSSANDDDSIPGANLKEPSGMTTGGRSSTNLSSPGGFTQNSPASSMVRTAPTKSRNTEATTNRPVSESDANKKRHK